MVKLNLNNRSRNGRLLALKEFRTFLEFKFSELKFKLLLSLFAKCEVGFSKAKSEEGTFSSLKVTLSTVSFFGLFGTVSQFSSGTYVSF